MDSVFQRRYSRWKGNLPSPRDSYFDRDVARTGVPLGADIFEAGFGEGHFLRWGRAQGYQCEGCEIVPEFVNTAREDGFNVDLGDLAAVLADRPNRYDLVVLFDVLEHIPIESIPLAMASISDSLRPGGEVLVRCPNGASPFGRFFQHGDLTHTVALNGLSLSQIAEASDLEFVGIWNAARDYRTTDHRTVLRLAAYGLRDLVEFVIGHAYFGQRVPLDPNITGLFRKPLVL